MSTAFITHSDCLLHDMGDHHPESPSRLVAIEDALKDAQIYDFLNFFEAPLATDQQITRVHKEEYLEYLKQNSPKVGHFHLDMDTSMNPFSLKAAYRACGATIKAVDLIMQKEVTNAFCNVRPPGHHAESDKAMGFCFFNNIAVAAAYALTLPEIHKVAIIDFDVHHGNGTEEIFEANENVLICSSFQHPNYPHKEFCREGNRIINAPLNPGSGSVEFREAVETKWLPQIKIFEPDFFFISAGFDAHLNDPLANLQLRTSDFEWVTKKVKELALQYASGRIVSSLEGGYHLLSLGKSAAAHIKVLMGI